MFAILQCGGCTVDQVSQVTQLLMNPAVWVMAAGAILAMVPKKKSEDKKK